MNPLLLSALLALAPAGEPPPVDPAEADPPATSAPVLEPAAEAWTWEPAPIPVEEAPSPSSSPTETPTETPIPFPTGTETSTATPTEAPASEEPTPADVPWYDETHAYVSKGLLFGIQRLDQFFGDDRQVDLPRKTSWVRWRNELRLNDHGTTSFSTSARAEIRIPSLDQRLEALRVTVTGGTNETLDQLLPGDPASADTPDQPSAGLRYLFLDTLRAQTDLSAGLLFGWPVGWYAKARLRYNQPLGERLLARFALSGFWQTPTGWGTRGDADLERQLAQRVLLRLANTATVTEVSRGWEWASELAVLAAVGQRTALFLGGGPSGATALGPSVEIWRVHAKARRDVLRRWLFLEVEPGLQWTRVPGGARLRERYVILRVELQFEAQPLARPPAEAP
jgi:hypothetical protein